MAFSTHKMSNTSIYSVWRSMKQRCLNKKNTKYKFYGGKGIAVCKRWLSFENFYSDMGDRPFKGATLERLDSSGNYNPLNVKWATYTEQNRNTNRNVFLDHNGERMTVSAWAEKLNMRQDTLYGRLFKGWSVKKSLETPVQNKFRNNNAK